MFNLLTFNMAHLLQSYTSHNCTNYGNSYTTNNNTLKACKKWKLSDKTDIRISYINGVPMIRISNSFDISEIRPKTEEDASVNSLFTIFLSNENFEYLTNNWNKINRAIQNNKDLTVNLFSPDSFDEVDNKCKIFTKNNILNITEGSKQSINTVTLNLNEMQSLSIYMSDIIEYMKCLTHDQYIFNELIASIVEVIYNMIENNLSSPNFKIDNPDHIKLYFTALNEIACFHYYANIVEQVKNKMAKMELNSKINIYFLFFSAISQHNILFQKLTEFIEDISEVVSE